MSPETAVWETLPALKLQHKVCSKYEKRRFLKKLGTAKVLEDLQERGRKIRFASPIGE